MNKTDLIHIRIDPETKKQAEAVLSRLGINTSHAVSIFLNMVIMNNGLPFSVVIPEKETEAELFALAIDATGTNGIVSQKSRNLIHLYAKGEIDYETAAFALNREEDFKTALVNLSLVKIFKTPIVINSVFSIFTIHKTLFENVYQEAGQKRTEDTEDLYVKAGKIDSELKKIDKEFAKINWEVLSDEQKIEQIIDISSSIWKVHPFKEGNTKTISVFIFELMRKVGLKLNLAFFTEHARFFKRGLNLALTSKYTKSNHLKMLLSDTNEKGVPFFGNSPA